MFCWFYLFPNGRFVPRWTRWLALAFLVWWPLPNLIFGDKSPATIQILVVGLLNVLLFGTLIATQIYRYRHVSTATQRLQTKWVVYGVALFVGGILTAIIVDVLRESGQDIFISEYGLITVVYVVTLLLPLSISLAILRYRLYDIDLIIRKTLVYSMLTLTLGALYVGAVVVLQRLLGPLTGSSDVALVASTLAIAALFQPLRRRIQQLIDKRFYRTKYDAQQVLAAFGARLQQETDLDTLTADLCAVIQETLQPEFVSLWIKETKSDEATK